MALSEFEVKQCEEDLVRFLDRRRPPPEIRSQVDLGYRIHGQSVELFEIRPRWDNTAIRVEVPISKTTLVRTQEIWRIYWMRKDGKWHIYRPHAEAETLEDVLAVIDRDQYGCFFG